MGLGQGKQTNKQTGNRKDLKNILLVARRNGKDAEGKKTESAVNGLVAVAEKFLDASKEAEDCLMSAGILMESWRSKLNF